MAVTQNDKGKAASAGKRFMIGTNVIVAIVLALAVVVVVQMIAYATPARVDMTSSGVNSLGTGTENLLRGLEKNVRITSLYFETDREEADQPRYRKTVDDLIDLYASTNRGKVQAEWINPLKDHEKYQTLLSRLRELPEFKEAIAAYQARVEHFTGELAGKIGTVLQEELKQTGELTGGGMANEQQPSPLAQVDMLLRQVQAGLERTQEQLSTLTAPPNPQYSTAVSELRSFYSQVSKAFKDVGAFGTQVISRVPDLQEGEKTYLQTAGNRYAEIVAAIEAETTKLQDLKPLDLDSLAAQLAPTNNAILVETDEDAKVVDFSEVWPPIDPGMGGRVRFDKRAFKGEQELTSAILRVTHKEQTAVVFVRYGGPPLFFGGMPGMPQQQGAPYMMVKEQLEDANFMVEEWDLKTTDDPPKLDPVPTRTIFIVLRPEPPPRDPMGRPAQEPPFSDVDKEALLKAMGPNGRALFVAGWAPGMFGMIPGTYEYSQYLKDQWGIEIETDTLLLEVIPVEGGQYAATRDSIILSNLETKQHPIVSNPLAQDISLPSSAPLKLADPAPEGVTYEPLLVAPRREDLWGVKDLTKYQQQLQTSNYLTRVETDPLGPFLVAVAATKGDSKIVVVSSKEFAMDEIAFARQMAMTSEGIVLRARNAGNIILLINSLHWLNDNMEFMNVGQPIDAAVLRIPDRATVTAVQVLTIFVWPALALVLGGAAWLIRRR